MLLTNESAAGFPLAHKNSKRNRIISCLLVRLRRKLVMYAEFLNEYYSVDWKYWRIVFTEKKRQMI